MPVGQYDKQGQIALPLNLDGLALVLLRADHGIHRFLSAAVRARKQFKVETEDDSLLVGIEKLLTTNDDCVLLSDECFPEEKAA